MTALKHPFLDSLHWIVVTPGVLMPSGYTQAHVITTTKAEAVAWMKARKVWRRWQDHEPGSFTLSHYVVHPLADFLIDAPAGVYPERLPDPMSRPLLSKLKWFVTTQTPAGPEHAAFFCRTRAEAVEWRRAHRAVHKTKDVHATIHPASDLVPIAKLASSAGASLVA